MARARAPLDAGSCRRSTSSIPGYWIWFIPLHDGITSVGVTGPTGFDERALRTPEGFRGSSTATPRSRTCCATRSRSTSGSYTQIAYSTERFFSPDRWGLTGEAATAADPLYSPGTDFIAHENDFLTELIRRDFAGESAAEIAERCELYDGFMKFRQEATLAPVPQPVRDASAASSSAS